MPRPILLNLWLEDNGQAPLAMRLDWSNDRHQRVEIPRLGTTTDVLIALQTLKELLIIEDWKEDKLD